MNDDAGTPGATWDQDIQAISDWIIGHAIEGHDLADTLDTFCERARAAGLPVARVHVAMTTLHPMFEARSMRWNEAGVEYREQHPHRDAPGDDWLKSPLRPLTEAGQREVRYPMESQGLWRDFPLLVELEAVGFTDYFGAVSPFGPEDEALARQDGMLMGWATRRAGGFTETHIAAIRRLQMRFAAAAKIANREETALNILSAYLGGDAATRVLDGQIKLGDGEVIPSVIWYSDLRHSTDLADSLPGEAFLAVLNDYFHCTAGAVLDHGGDVLRFIGDAVLAIFPIAEGRFTTAEACARAIEAARDADRRIAELNDDKGDLPGYPVAYGLALHVGPVLFGNIGVPERVEFSVIGPAANEVCRLEGKTKDLGRAIVVSEAFAKELDLDWQDLGEHALKGVGTKRRVLAPPPP